MKAILNKYKIPKKVSVNGSVYRVKYVKDLRDADGKKLDGHIMYGPAIIALEKSLSRQTKWQVLLHEIVHSILTQANQEQNEAAVDALSFGLIGIFAYNKLRRRK